MKGKPRGRKEDEGSKTNSGVKQGTEEWGCKASVEKENGRQENETGEKR
jgi:hypothetical protein